jgi:hypothetical protein
MVFVYKTGKGVLPPGRTGRKNLLSMAHRQQRKKLWKAMVRN